MQLPAININGTARSDLLEQHMNARRLLSKAIEGLQECAPHGRDYQTLPDGQNALHKALDEHSNRLLKLRQVAIELETICEHVI
jgi:hypothetical protein